MHIVYAYVILAVAFERGNFRERSLYLIAIFLIILVGKLTSKPSADRATAGNIGAVIQR